ncbi:MAG: hypothetical protein ACU841_17335 [Gammaproteobacteria bacterium]
MAYIAGVASRKLRLLQHLIFEGLVRVPACHPYSIDCAMPKFSVLDDLGRAIPFCPFQDLLFKLRRTAIALGGFGF